MRNEIIQPNSNRFQVSKQEIPKSKWQTEIRTEKKWCFAIYRKNGAPVKMKDNTVKSGN